MSDFTRTVEVTSSDPRSGRAVGYGVRICWYLRGPLGVIQFVMRVGPDGVLAPWDVGYHSPTETESGTAMESCDLFDGAPCWYDGSSLQADAIWRKVASGGDKALWAELEEYYEAWLVADREEAAS